MTQTEMHLKSWNRFITRNFTVHPDVMGKCHTFEFNGARVTITLPTAEQANRDPSYDNVARISSWRTDTKEPIKFDVLRVDVTVDRQDKVKLDPEVLNRAPIASDLIDGAKKHKLDEIANSNTRIAEEAFAYWCSILRWVTDKYYIARYEVTDNQTGWSTYLQEISSKHSVWSYSYSIIVSDFYLMTLDEWLEAEAKLQHGEICPQYITLLHDAEDHASRRDYRRSLIDLAIACETFIRYQVLDRLPASVDADVKEMLEQANINQYVSKFFPNRLSEAGAIEFRKLKGDLSSLFDARNKIMHMDKTDRANEETCRRFVEVTRKLFAMRDRMK